MGGGDGKIRKESTAIHVQLHIESKASLGHRSPCPKKLKKEILISHRESVCYPFMYLQDSVRNGNDVNTSGKRERKKGWGAQTGTRYVAHFKVTTGQAFSQVLATE